MQSLGAGLVRRALTCVAASVFLLVTVDPLVGQTSANDMYFAVARWQFKDNQYKPNCNGNGCIAPTTLTQTWSGVTTIADLITGAGHSFNVYAEGLTAMHQYPAPLEDLWAHQPCGLGC